MLVSKMYHMMFYNYFKGYSTGNPSHIYGDRTFSSSALKLCNFTPEDIKSASSIQAFKSKLKTFLLGRVNFINILVNKLANDYFPDI